MSDSQSNSDLLFMQAFDALVQEYIELFDAWERLTRKSSPAERLQLMDAIAAGIEARQRLQHALTRACRITTDRGFETGPYNDLAGLRPTASAGAEPAISPYLRARVHERIAQTIAALDKA